MICDNCIHNAVCEMAHFENHCGYKHTEADIIISELEKIKAEINQYGSIMAEWNDNMTKEEIVESVLKQAKECVLFVLDNHIKELKGENNE